MNLLKKTMLKLIYQTMHQNLPKNTTGIDTSKLALRLYLVNLKAKIDKIDVGKLKTVPVDLIKISNVVNNVVKKLCITN